MQFDAVVPGLCGTQYLSRLFHFNLDGLWPYCETNNTIQSSMIRALRIRTSSVGLSPLSVSTLLIFAMIFIPVSIRPEKYVGNYEFILDYDFMCTVNSRFKKDLNLQIQLHKTFLVNYFSDPGQKSFLNQTILNSRKKEWRSLIKICL